MVTTVRIDGFLARDHVRLQGLVNADTFTTKLSTVENVQYTMQDASATGTALVMHHTVSGRIITFNLVGITSGTANVVVYGRL